MGQSGRGSYVGTCKLRTNESAILHNYYLDLLISSYFIGMQLIGISFSVLS